MGESEIMGNLYQRFPVRVERGEGALVWDDKGRSYVDCMAGYGVALLGHANRGVADAVAAQMSRITTVHASLYSATREIFLERLTGLAPAGISRAFLCSSGSEAVEAAIKMARKATGRGRIVSMRGAYHGKTHGALSLTFNPKYKKAFGPMMEGVEFAPFGDAGALRDMVGDQTAMVIIEPVQGESGINVAPDGFLEEARGICDGAGALLAFDEIQAGLGRTGRMWACDHWGVAPDIMCLAKGLAGGVPMGAALTTEAVMSAMSKGEHSSTFGGNPLACAAGTETLSQIEGGLVGNAAAVGAGLMEGLREISARHPVVREVRGLGLMIGVELKFDVRGVLDDLIDDGVLMLYSGRNILRLLPPLVITHGQASKVLHSLDLALGAEEERRGIR
ncbi:MAG: aspartate aminotransferase family protein [Nitrosopumilus sp.]|nr:aspartate aminotransferase family protein [Nitrosopumilus sp.]